MGLEPTTSRLEVWRAIHCATRALSKNYFEKPIFIVVVLTLINKWSIGGSNPGPWVY